MAIWPACIPNPPSRKSILKSRYPETCLEAYAGEEDSNWKRSPSPFIDICSKPFVRPYTTTGYYRVLNPYVCHAGSIKDSPDDIWEPSYVFGLNKEVEKEPLTYVPAWKSWVTSNINCIESDSAAKVSRAMQRPTYSRSRSMSPMRTRCFYGRPMPQYDDTPMNPYFPRESTTYLNDFGGNGNEAYRMPNLSQMYGNQTAREPRPRARLHRRASLSKDYVHDLSCFQFTQPMVAGHFVIHPDWVSERMPPMLQPRKKNRIQY